MTTSVTKIWRTNNENIYAEDYNHEYKDWKEAHSSILFVILRALEKGNKVVVIHQDGLNAQLKIQYKEGITCDINMQSM